MKSHFPNFIDMPVPASYNDITTDAKELRDHVGWVWYETDAVIPRAWTRMLNCKFVLQCNSACSCLFKW